MKWDNNNRSFQVGSGSNMKRLPSKSLIFVYTAGQTDWIENITIVSSDGTVSLKLLNFSSVAVQGKSFTVILDSTQATRNNLTGVIMDIHSL